MLAFRSAGALVFALVTLSMPGCTDTRITLDEFNRLETEAAQVEPVELTTEDLALTELRPYTVGPGDILSITFTGMGEDPFAQNVLTVRVHDDGKITLPKPQDQEGETERIHVAGLDLKQVEDELYKSYVPEYVKGMSVFVQLGGPETTTVVVVGAAGQSGLVTLPRNERNVLYALSRAAGFGPAGSGRVRVLPVRSQDAERSYDLTQVNDLRRVLTDAPLRSGDMIVVEPAEASAVYVTGLVNAPGPIPVPQHGTLSLVRTIAASGGLRDFLDPQEATLWRRLPDGRQVRVKLALADVMSGKLDDLALYPGDVLDVPHTAETRFREWFAANIRLGPFGVTAMYDPVADYRARILANDDQDLFRRTLLQSLSTGVSELLVPPVPTAPVP